MGDFKELANVEENAERCLGELLAEEVALRHQLQVELVRQEELMEREIEMESKLKVILRNTGELGVANLEERVSSLKQRIKDITEMISQLSLDAIQYSTEMRIEIGRQTSHIDNSIKEFKNPPTLNNSLRTKKVKSQWTQRKIQELDVGVENLNLEMDRAEWLINKDQLNSARMILSYAMKSLEKVDASLNRIRSRVQQRR